MEPLSFANLKKESALPDLDLFKQDPAAGIDESIQTTTKPPYRFAYLEKPTVRTTGRWRDMASRKLYKIYRQRRRRRTFEHDALYMHVQKIAVNARMQQKHLHARFEINDILMLDPQAQKKFANKKLVPKCCNIIRHANCDTINQSNQRFPSSTTSGHIGGHDALCMGDSNLIANISHGKVNKKLSSSKKSNASFSKKTVDCKSNIASSVYKVQNSASHNANTATDELCFTMSALINTSYLDAYGDDSKKSVSTQTIPTSRVKADDKKEQLCNSFSIKNALKDLFMPERLHSQLESLIYWRNVEKSAFVFVTGLLLLSSLAICSFDSVICYLPLCTLITAMAFRIFYAVLFNKNPFERYLQLNLEVSQEMLLNILDPFNYILAELQTIFLIQNFDYSLCCVLALWQLTRFDVWHKFMALAVHAFLAIFTVPKIYESNKQFIDALLSRARPKYIWLVGKLTETLDKVKKYEARLFNDDFAESD